MIVTVKGTVFNSALRNGKKMATTAITQSDEDMQTVKLSTFKVYERGSPIEIQCKVSATEYKGKTYLVCVEIHPTDGEREHADL